MSLGREDMLRELELLPIWQPRMPISRPAQVVTTTVEHVPQAMPAPAAVMGAEAVQPAPATPAAAAMSAPVPVTAPTITTDWLLVSPQAADADCQPLLQAIVQAMRLPDQSWTLVPQGIASAEAQSRFVVLFGLEAAAAFLGAPPPSLDAVRGRVHVHGQSQLVITHHPRDMLAQAALKKEAWHDLCLLLSKKD